MSLKALQYIRLAITMHANTGGACDTCDRHIFTTPASPIRASWVCVCTIWFLGVAAQIPYHHAHKPAHVHRDANPLNPICTCTHNTYELET